MKTNRHATLIFFPLFLCIAVCGQSKNDNYDSALAKKLGADEYGMKNYILVILKSGSNHVTDKTTRDSLFSGHMTNIKRLGDMGKLVVAGPFGDNDKNYRGIFILNVKTVEEAKALLETDPAVKAKVFDTDLYNWYGSASLQEVSGLHKKIQKLSF